MLLLLLLLVELESEGGGETGVVVVPRWIVGASGYFLIGPGGRAKGWEDGCRRCRCNGGRGRGLSWAAALPGGWAVDVDGQVAAMFLGFLLSVVFEECRGDVGERGRNLEELLGALVAVLNEV